MRRAWRSASRKIAQELFDFYERGGPHIEVDARERQLAGMREWEKYLLELVAAFVREALRPAAVEESQVQLVSALFDLPTFKAFSARGVASDTAAETVASIAASLVDGPDTSKEDQ